MAQVAIQQAKNLSKNLRKIDAGETDLKPFRYKDLGSMATVGRNKAVMDVGKVHSQGFIAWLLWLVVHLRSILGIRNKLMVFLNWVWNYITYDDSIRMIVYATKPKEIRERMERERRTHLGTDLLAEMEAEKKAKAQDEKKN